MWLVVIMSVMLAKTVSAGWNNTIYYKVLVDSFKDSDGDGLGDLIGATKQLSYIGAVGADAVILSPINAKSPDCDHPGTVGFTEIDQRYGDEDSLTKLIEKSRKLDLKMLVSVDVRSISTLSECFNLSAARTLGFEDWVLWQDTPADPKLDGVDWVWNDIRNSYYASINNETLLNLCSDGVTEAFRRAQCIWLQRGFAGLVLSPDFTINHECGVNFVQKMAVYARSCTRAANIEKPIILIDTAFEIETASKYYDDSVTIISNALTGPVRTSPSLAVALHTELVYCPQDMTPTWRTSNSENRIFSRYGSAFVDAIIIISLFLPGSTIIQQGDELGAADTLLEWATTNKCWPILARPFAAPFPWDDSPSAGFTSGESWLTLAPNYRYANAKIEFANEQSHFGVVRAVAVLRKSPDFGPHYEIKRIDDALVILRWGAIGSLLMVSNLGQRNCEIQLSKIPGLPNEMTAAVSSGGSSSSTGVNINMNKLLKLVPGETILMAGPPRHCGGPGPVDKIANKLSEGWQKINKYFSV
ncbi:maltase 1 [Pieris rapae]|uniref:maltase 1 n=1 Tax=Pieris rapae TaxID=64459 RepID=UPI001E27FE0D|nr:maltase 1 [Pieris rapae]